MRVVIVNADVLKTRKDAVLRFAKAYREAVDWMYADPDAIKRYAQKVMSPEEFVRRSIPKIYPKASLQTDEMKDMDGHPARCREIEVPRSAARQGAAGRASADSAAVMMAEAAGCGGAARG